MRDEIAEMLTAGYTRDEVIDELVNQYGVWILMTPPAEGRFVWVYLTPFLVIGIGSVAAHMLLSRRRQQPPPDDGDDDDSVEVDPDLEAACSDGCRSTCNESAYASLDVFGV